MAPNVVVRSALSLSTLLLLATGAAAQSSAVDSVRALFAADQDVAAMSFAQAAVKARPEDADSHCALAIVYDMAERQEEASESAERCVELEPDVAEYQFIYGDALMEWAGQKGGLGALGPAKRGKAALEKAVKLDPDNLDAYLSLFFFHMEAPGIAGGSKKEAKRLSQAIDQRDPAMGVFTRYRLSLEKPKDDELAGVFDEALALCGTPADSLGYAMAAAIGVAARVDSDVLAEQLIARLYDLHPDDPRAQYYRARLWVMQGRNLEQSEEIFSAYVELAERPPQSPSLAGARWRLGMVYEKQGRKAEALEQYRLAAELDPEWEQPREEIERLEKELSGR